MPPFSQVAESSRCVPPMAPSPYHHGMPRQRALQRLPVTNFQSARRERVGRDSVWRQRRSPDSQDAGRLQVVTAAKTRTVFQPNVSGFIRPPTAVQVDPRPEQLKYTLRRPPQSYRPLITTYRLSLRRDSEHRAVQCVHCHHRADHPDRCFSRTAPRTLTRPIPSRVESLIELQSFVLLRTLCDRTLEAGAAGAVGAVGMDDGPCISARKSAMHHL
jgi:hypothetical protein